MSKIAILNDTHLGCRNGSEIFLNNMEKFYNEIFFPYLLKNNINQIIHLGDYYDHRKFINFKVLNKDRQMFLSKLKEYNIFMDIIPGNHDVYHKNTNEVCSLLEVLKPLSENINVLMKPVVKTYYNTPIALVPWISSDNTNECLEFISKNPASIIMGHFDISGFEMMKGGAVSHGMDSNLFSKYEMVLSGHFHTKSTKENITYLGTQFETTWSDYNDPKFFHVLDTQTRNLISILNPNKLFYKITYDDTDSLKNIKWLDNFNFSYIKDCFVKIIILNKNNPIIFDKFLEKVQSYSPFEIKIIDSFSDLNDSEEIKSNSNLIIDDTKTLINNYIDNLEIGLNKNRLKQKLQNLYIEAQNLESV